MFLGFFSLTLSFRNFQIFSIGFMSGLWAGHSITVTSSSERNVLTDFAVWHGALSRINTAGWLIAVLKLGTAGFFNISLYTVALIQLCSLIRGSVPASEIIPNTITLLPPNSIVNDGVLNSLRTHFFQLKKCLWFKFGLYWVLKIMMVIFLYIYWILVHWGEHRSLGLHWTNLLPSQPNRLNFDSSLKWTQPHCSSVQMTCSMANFNHLICFFLEM